MRINIEKVPFSSKGCYLAVSKDHKSLGGGIWLRSLIRPEWGTGRKKVSDHLFRFLTATRQGAFCQNEVECLPWQLTLKGQEGSIRLHFSGDSTLSLSIDKLMLVLEHDHDELTGQVERVDPQLLKLYFPIIHYNAEIQVQGGEIQYYGKYKRIFITPDKDLASVTIKAYRKDLGDGREAPEADVESLRQDYLAFISHYAPKNQTEELAAYILWSTQYARKGRITRRCNAISKSLMNLVWSWDNCFNALGVARADPELAWGNLLLFFDLQCENGMLPDAVNPAIVVDWFTKPPVHGWAVGQLLARGVRLHDVEKESLYHGLKRWTDWWYSRPSVGGLFCYRHPFDSGWDNATVFDDEALVATPDLNAYLVLQQDMLSTLAQDLGLTDEAESWKASADKLLDNLLCHMWNGVEFLCLRLDGRAVATNSLMRMMPVVLGKRLPAPIMKTLVTELAEENHFLTPRGLATESLRSRLYDHRKGDPAKPNAYWRGPIWPPVVYLMVSGLLDAGETHLASLIAERYIATVEQTPDALYENYDALTGEGNDDPSYAWTSAVYLLLKNLF